MGHGGGGFFWSEALDGVARQSKPLVQRQSGIHPMVEQRPVGKLVSSPKPPEAGAQRARLYTSLTAGDHNSRMQLTLEDAHSRQRGLIVATSMVLIVAQHRCNLGR